MPLTSTSHRALMERSMKSIPGGVNSPVRAFGSVGGDPIFFASAQGATLVDVHGKEYIDLINSWGPMILGHNHTDVIDALREQLDRAVSFGAPTVQEIELAELVRAMVPSVDLIRMVSSGTEACMSALRLARGYTGKNKFIKMEGHYHGHADPFLVKAGSGLATFGIQHVPGITEGTAQDTLVCPFNDISAVENMCDKHQGEIAAIILEPVAGNMGCIPPAAGYLQAIRQICDDQDIVLIFDEVMTGFRLAAGGVQELASVTADLVTFGKVIGGGLPVGAFGGKREIMSHIAPLGQVYQAGTLSGNPLAMTAGHVTLSHLHEHPEYYARLEHTGKRLAEGLQQAFDHIGITVAINQLGSMISVHFSEVPVTDFSSASGSDISTFNRYFHHMLEHGIYLPPSAYESWFLSLSLTDEHIDHIIHTTKKFS